MKEKEWIEFGQIERHFVSYIEKKKSKHGLIYILHLSCGRSISYEESCLEQLKMLKNNFTPEKPKCSECLNNIKKEYV